MTWQTIVKTHHLDISELRVSELLSGVRIDAEVYAPEYLRVESLVSSVGTVSLESLSERFTKGIFEINASLYMERDGVPFVRIGNLKSALIDEDGMVHIPENESNKNKNTILSRGDIVLSKTAIPAASYVDIPLCNVSQDTIGIKYSGTDIASEWVVAFLNSKYGLGQMKRWFTGNIQMHLNLTDAKNIRIPVPPVALNTKVREIFKTYVKLRNQAQNTYSQAEAVLLDELGWSTFITDQQKISIRSSRICADSGRLDAEYWQPKYDKIELSVKNYSNGYGTLSELFIVSDQTRPIKPDAEYNYIELSDINGVVGTIDNSTHLFGSDLPSRAKMALRKDDILVSSVEGSISKTAIVSNELPNMVGSTGFFVLRADYFLPEAALILLKSAPINALLKREAQGTILTAVPKTSLSRVLVPKLTEDSQRTLAALVRVSHEERNESKSLLRNAIKTVEVFIEDGEKAALEFLDIFDTV